MWDYHSLTCVEDTGGQRWREALVQQQFAENHPDRLPREAPLQGPEPEVIKVSMETGSHDGHVTSVSPVNALLLSYELMDQVTSGKEAAVQGDIGQPGESFGGFFQHSSPHFDAGRRNREPAYKWCWTAP